MVQIFLGSSSNNSIGVVSFIFIRSVCVVGEYKVSHAKQISYRLLEKTRFPDWSGLFILTAFPYIVRSVSTGLCSVPLTYLSLPISVTHCFSDNLISEGHLTSDSTSFSKVFELYLRICSSIWTSESSPVFFKINILGFGLE